MALPVDPRIEALLAAARGRVTAGNAQRNQLALMTALGLTGAGLLERSGATLARTEGAGFSEAPSLLNEVYGVNVGPEGRAYRQGLGQVASSAASRGAGWGTAVQNQQIGVRRELGAQIQNALRGFDASQANLLQEQAGGLGELGTGIADIRFEQAREMAAQAVPAPAAATPATPQPLPGGGFSQPGPIGDARIVRLQGPDYSVAANRNSWLKRWGADQWQIKRAGPGWGANQWVAVRR